MRRPLQRIVLKFTALIIYRNYAVLGAKHLILCQLRAVTAVLAGFGHFLSEQHIAFLLKRDHYTQVFLEWL